MALKAILHNILIVGKCFTVAFPNCMHYSSDSLRRMLALLARPHLNVSMSCIYSVYACIYMYWFACELQCHVYCTSADAPDRKRTACYDIEVDVVRQNYHVYLCTCTSMYVCYGPSLL